MGGDWRTQPLPARNSRLQMPLATPKTGASVPRWTLSGTGWFVEGPTSGERGREKKEKQAGAARLVRVPPACPGRCTRRGQQRRSPTVGCCQILPLHTPRGRGAPRQARLLLVPMQRWGAGGSTWRPARLPTTRPPSTTHGCTHRGPRGDWPRPFSLPVVTFHPPVFLNVGVGDAFSSFC